VPMRMYQLTELERQFVVDTLKAVAHNEDADSVEEQVDESLEILESLQPAEVPL
jgi:hypothetical protein